MLQFIRSDLAQLTAYTPHPVSHSGTEVDLTHPSQIETSPVDRLDANESPFDLPQELKQKLAWLSQETIESNRYPDGGHGQLRQAIAAYVSESANPALETPWITPSHISVGNGSDELIRSLLIATCLGGAGSILVAEPTFSMYGILARTLGIPVVTVGRSPVNFAMDLAAAQNALETTQAPPIRVVFVVHPNSPTGNALTSAELDWLRSLPEEVLVVIDEAYFEFSQTTVVHELPQRPNWVVLRTFSKAFRLAAYRVGYSIAHPELIAILEKVRLPYNLPSHTLAAAELALAHRHQLLESVPLLVQEREHMAQILAQHSQLQVWPSVANFLYAQLREPQEPLQQAERLSHLCQQLRLQGTRLRQISGGIRITVGTPEENQRVRDRLQTLL